MPYDATADVADQIIESCEKHLNAFRADCSGFARAVAADFGITLVGDANHLAEVLETRWLSASDAREAGRLAGQGKFVIAAKAEPQGRHGHVAIIVKDPRCHTANIRSPIGAASAAPPAGRSPSPVPGPRRPCRT
jgi:hypothetical protein